MTLSFGPFTSDPSGAQTEGQVRMHSWQAPPYSAAFLPSGEARLRFFKGQLALDRPFEFETVILRAGEVTQYSGDTFE
jgi:hypothetical protein